MPRLARAAPSGPRTTTRRRSAPKTWKRPSRRRQKSKIEPRSGKNRAKIHAPDFDHEPHREKQRRLLHGLRRHRLRKRQLRQRTKLSVKNWQLNGSIRHEKLCKKQSKPSMKPTRTSPSKCQPPRKGTNFKIFDFSKLFSAHPQNRLITDETVSRMLPRTKRSRQLSDSRITDRRERFRSETMSDVVMWPSKSVTVARLGKLKIYDPFFGLLLSLLFWIFCQKVLLAKTRSFMKKTLCSLETRPLYSENGFLDSAKITIMLVCSRNMASLTKF